MSQEGPNEFLDRFESVIQDYKAGAADRKQLRQAMRATNKLADTLEALSDGQDVEWALGVVDEIRERLNMAEPSGSAMQEMLDKASALAKLEGIVELEITERAANLARKAREILGERRRKGGDLPSPLHIICVDCDEKLGESQRWGYVRYKVRQHHENEHDGDPEEIALQVRQALRKLREGSAEETFSVFRLTVSP